MLSKKYRMTPHGCLLAIIGDDGGCQTLSHKISGMTTDGSHTFSLNISLILGRQLELTAEGGLRKAFEECRMVIALCLNLLGGRSWLSFSFLVPFRKQGWPVVNYFTFFHFTLLFCPA